MAPSDSLPELLRTCFRDLFGEQDGLRIAVAPGRVNLIGEHTDYNDGWVLPMAIDRYVGVAFRARDDRRIRAHAIAFDETHEIRLDSPEPPGNRGWISYVVGMARVMAESGLDLSGVNCVIGGDLPLGSGLSSSAALEMATARALGAASGVPWSPRRMARLGREAEHRFVGVNCGLMDQLASALAEQDCAILLDCRSQAAEAVPIPASAKVVVMDTGVRRSLAGSAYNERRSSCEAALELLRGLDSGARALRDADTGLLNAGRSQMDELTFRRAKHVVEENRRPQAMAQALREGDIEQAGSLMNESHASLRDLYEVSSFELDLITDLARRHSACFGARLTGAGFGGCAIALVAAADVDAFTADVHSAYRAEVDLPSELFACKPVAGARLLGPTDTLENAPADSLKE
ncbi:MAG: galactokinase [bacterium]|nr:galactokinase [bacterium]